MASVFERGVDAARSSSSWNVVPLASLSFSSCSRAFRAPLPPLAPPLRLSLVFFLALAISSSPSLLHLRSSHADGVPASKVNRPLVPLLFSLPSSLPLSLSLTPSLLPFLAFSRSLIHTHTHTLTLFISFSRVSNFTESTNEICPIQGREREERGPLHASAHADLSQKFARKLTVNRNGVPPRHVLLAGKRFLTKFVRRKASFSRTQAGRTTSLILVIRVN